MKLFITGLLLLALGGAGCMHFRDPMTESRATVQRVIKPALPKATNGPNRGWVGWPCPQNEVKRGFTACAQFNNGNITAQKHRDGFYEVEFYVADNTRHVIQLSNGAITSAVGQVSGSKGWEVVRSLPLSLDATKTDQLWALEGFEGWQGVAPIKEKRSGPKRPEQ